MAIQEMEAAVKCLVSQKSFKDKYESMGYIAADGSAATLKRYMREEPKKWKPLIDASTASSAYKPEKAQISH
jgi:tripartite-type tricarboxylate transporter receptor subunit TctC